MYMCLCVCNCWLCRVNLGITDESGKTLLELATKFDQTAVIDYLNSSTCEFGFFDRKIPLRLQIILCLIT